MVLLNGTTFSIESEVARYTKFTFQSRSLASPLISHRILNIQGNEGYFRSGACHFL
jgi:hypothetical protein